MAGSPPRRRVARERRESTLAALASRRAAGTLGRVDVARAAEGLGVGERTVWRWLAEASREKDGSRFELSEEDLRQLAYWNGNVAAFHRARGGTPSLRTLYRAVHHALTRGQLAGLTGGERARREFDTYATRPATHRNQCWGGDHCELAIEVRLPDGQIIKPWLTAFVDRYCRGLCGWALAGYPSQESVLAALRSGLIVGLSAGVSGGIPDAIRWDRGKEFLATTIRTVALALAIDAKALPPYSPHLKGAVERFHETIETRLLAELPGFVHVPTGRSGRRRRTQEPLLSLAQFVELFTEFAKGYNELDVHQALDGETPLQRWAADQTPVRTIPAEHLNHLLLAREPRVVGKKGVRILGGYYNCADLVGLVGEAVEVRYMPHHHDRVEVFLRDVYVGTAVRADDMDETELKRLIARRRGEERWLARQRAAAERQRRRKFAAVTAPGGTTPPVDADLTLRLTPSRSLRLPREIPEGWVRPLTAEEVEERRRREKSH